MSISSIDWQGFGERFTTYLKELTNFNFHISNPVFWLFFCIIFLILLKLWTASKAFSFCAVIALILLASTKAEAYVAGFFSKSGESFDGVIIKIVTTVLICVVILYYSCIKSNY